MLEKVDLTRRLTKEEAQPRISALQERLRILQHAALSAGVATTIVLEGWDAAGKGLLVSRLVEKLDPRGFKVRATYAAIQEELYRPWLWRFWMKLPAYGEIVVFDRSWYGRVLIERIERVIGKKLVELSFQEIVDFERSLVDDGQVLVKLFLHISKKEQRRRYHKCEADPHTRWKIKPEDWRHHEQYADYYRAIEEMLERTSTTHAPWAVVEATDKRWAEVEMLTRIAEAIEARLKVLGKLPTERRLAAVVPAASRPNPPKKKPTRSSPARSAQGS